MMIQLTVELFFGEYCRPVVPKVVVSPPKATAGMRARSLRPPPREEASQQCAQVNFIHSTTD